MSEQLGHAYQLYTEISDDITPLSDQITYQAPFEQLNSIFTNKKLLDAISKLKNCKSEWLHHISNEMAKNFPLNVLNILLKYINLCVTPILKWFS